MGALADDRLRQRTAISMSKDNTEIIRRLRLGDLRKLVRYRYGPTLPDDDAGREDLYELLLPISLGPEDGRKMTNAIEIHAPWMGPDEVGQLIDRINRTPDYERKRKARFMGQKLNVTNAEREILKLQTIAPFDMTNEELEEQRKAKKRARMQRQRRAAGRKPREAYLAGSLNRREPWKIEGISRRTWERRRAKDPVASLCPVKLSNAQHSLASLEQVERSKELAIKTVEARGRRKSARALGS